MNFTDEQREDAYNTATAKQRSLYEGSENGQALYTISQRHGISDQDRHLHFLVAVGDVILGLVPQEKLPELFVERLQISQPDAMRITADVLDFLAPLNQPTNTPVPITTQPQPAEMTKVSTDSQDTLAAELAETEAAFKQLQPIRTMAHDMETIRTEEEPVHQAASQETILNGQGNAEKNTTAQWGTPEK